MSSFGVSTRNLVFACYVASLMIGHTLLAICIKVVTIKKYIGAVRMLASSLKLPDPTLDDLGRRAPSIRALITEAQRWENMPNRREPLTVPMVEWVIHEANKERKYGRQDGLYCSLADWLIMGLQSGFCQGEWAQESSTFPNTFELNRDGTAKAFIRSDFKFTDSKNRRINEYTKSALRHAKFTSVKWRFQKNNDNGQEVTYSKSTSPAGLCYTTAATNIILRSERLKVPEGSPIAVFKDYKLNKIKFISTKEIRMVLRQAAKAVHNIHSQADLQKFTAHSIRVGACVLLHSAGRDFEYIKFRLRWRSDSFRMYLRNVTALALQHADIIDDVTQTNLGNDDQEQSPDLIEDLTPPSPPSKSLPSNKPKKKKKNSIPLRWSKRIQRRT